MAGELIPLKRLAAGVYETLDGRYRIENQPGTTMCEHELCDTLHRKYHSRDPRTGAVTHWVEYPEWIVWDNVKDDHASVGDIHATKRDAHRWLTSHVEGRS